MSGGGLGRAAGAGAAALRRPVVARAAGAGPVVGRAAGAGGWEPPRRPVPPPSGPPSHPAPRPRSRRSPRAIVAAEVNRRRERAGGAPVRLRRSLNRAAQTHSADMARHRRLTHVGPDGRRPTDRMRAAGYRPGATGEAVASGAASARAVVGQWMDSPPHRAILLTCRYTDAGVGVAHGPGGPWWTLDLAARH
ncbi:CAP domain-containing protein [Streptomyces sp. NPDC040750]|uniref:CAP domain-containing protein n=1 Tax=Streptomyces sp. NPDC040750 TaxID=3154491 RepID=UPI0033F4D135